MLSRESAPKYGVTHGALIITETPVDAMRVKGQSLLQAGPLTVAGLYECEIATDGMNDIEVEIMPSAVTGTFDCDLRAMRANRASYAAANEDDGADFIAGTSQVLTLSNLLGRPVCKLVFTIPGGGSIEFDQGADPTTPTAVAEFHGI